MCVMPGPGAGTQTTQPSMDGTDAHRHIHHEMQPDLFSPRVSLPVSGLGCSSGLPSKAWTHLLPAVALPGLCWPERRAAMSQRTCPAGCPVSSWPSRPSCCAWWPGACCQPTPPLGVRSWAPAERKIDPENMHYRRWSTNVTPFPLLTEVWTNSRQQGLLSSFLHITFVCF